MKYNILSKRIENTSLTAKDNLDNLIRVLSRISTIPKFDNVDVLSSSEKPTSFKIDPGKSISLGNELLNNPVTTLLYLRFGIEWQIWYKALEKDKNYIKVIDIASLLVTKHFYDLLVASDKESIKEEKSLLPSLFHEHDNLDVGSIISSDDIILGLEEFHQLSAAPQTLDSKAIEIIQNFAKPTEYLLMEGGDDRLKIDELSLLNKYGCSPFPRPEAFTFASSTATSISNFAFDQADRERSKLITSSLKFDIHTAVSRFSNRIKSEIRNSLDLKRNCDVILSPSGTDSSLQIAAISQISTDKTITHVLVGSDETGSGVSTALLGHHFETSTALNFSVNKNDKIEGFRTTNVIEIPLKDSAGALRKDDEVDDEVLSQTLKAHDNGEYVVLHVIDQSKLGYRAPSAVLIKKLESLSLQNLQIIIDASQLRMNLIALNEYIERNYIVTVTGSKFFTGPPYAGALIIPKDLSDKIISKDASLPIGLNEYYNKLDWPKEWKCTESLSNSYNVGALLRWKAATSEMTRYFSTPLLYRNIGTKMFCSFVDESIQECKYLEPLYTEILSEEGDSFLGINSTRTIFPFFLKGEGKILDEERVKKIYVLLNSDLSEEMKEESIEVIQIASTKCHIGQGVSTVYEPGIETAVLRISLGARVISESWQQKDVSIFFRNIQEQMNQVTTIIKKIELILNFPSLYE